MYRVRKAANMTDRRFSRRTALIGGLELAAAVTARAASDVSPAAAAATANVPMFRGNPARTGEHPGPGPNAPVNALWATRLGTAVSATPALVDGTLFVGSVSSATLAGGALHAVDARTGEERWRLHTAIGDAFFASPAVVDGVVYAASYDGTVIAAHAESGDELWRFPAEAPVFSSPVVWKGAVCFGDTSGRFYCLDASTGQEQWRLEGDEPFRRAISASPAVTDDTIFVVHSAQYAGEDSILFALELSTGRERWRFAPADSGRVRSATCVANGRVHVSTAEGALWALSEKDGAEEWRYDGAGEVRTLPALSGAALYLITGPAPHQLHVLDPSSGARRMAVSVGGDAPIVSSPTVAKDIVYFGDQEGRLYAVDGESGEERWQAGVGSLSSTAVVANGAVYIGGEGGELRAVGGTIKPQFLSTNPSSGPPQRRSQGHGDTPRTCR
jgi:outer membrane protein assembly factor BamB